jgi:hypothetical protein
MQVLGARLGVDFSQLVLSRDAKALDPDDIANLKFMIPPIISFEP